MRANRRMRQHRKRAHRRHQRLTIMLLISDIGIYWFNMSIGYLSFV